MSICFQIHWEIKQHTGSTIPKTVPSDHPPFHCPLLNSTGHNWLCAHLHQNTRSGPLCLLMELGVVDKAGSALGRRREQPELPGSHCLVPAGTGYRDNTPHLCPGDTCQVQGYKWTGEAGKASRCLRKKTTQRYPGIKKTSYTIK